MKKITKQKEISSANGNRNLIIEILKLEELNQDEVYIQAVRSTNRFAIKKGREISQ